MLIFLFVLAMHDNVILEARYTQVPNTDAEYAQGAIERCELRHREIARFVWLIAVEPPGNPAEWQGEPAKHGPTERRRGRCCVQRATVEEEEAVRSGKIVLQR